MIYTLTISPAVDRTIHIDSLEKSGISTANKTLRQAAGKGINSAITLSLLGCKVHCLGFTAGTNGRFIKEELSSKNIIHDFIDIQGNTRENIKLVEKSTDTIFEINESDPNISEQDLVLLKEKLNTLNDKDILVISGRAHPSIKDTVYYDIIQSLPTVFTILDTSKEAFKEGIKAIPNVIKPNLEELEDFVGRKLESLEDIIQVGKSLMDTGIEQVYITLGGNGALALSKPESYYAKPLSITVGSTVGAGDSFIAGIAKSITMNYDIKTTLLHASAIASASTLTDGTGLFNEKDYLTFLEEITILKI